MSQEQYIIFERYPEAEVAKELVVAFREANINFELLDNSPAFDVTMSNNTMLNEVVLNVHKDDFERARKLQEELAEADIAAVGEDHYLYEFTNQELYEVLQKADEWSAFDVTLAKQVLLSRGEVVSKDLQQSLKKKRIEELSKTDDSESTFITWGYLCAFLGGLLGIFIGYHLQNGKRTLPNGDKVNLFTEKGQKQGGLIFTISCFTFPISFCFYVFSEAVLNMVG